MTPTLIYAAALIGFLVLAFLALVVAVERSAAARRSRRRTQAMRDQRDQARGERDAAESEFQHTVRQLGQLRAYVAGLHPIKQTAPPVRIRPSEQPTTSFDRSAT